MIMVTHYQEELPACITKLSFLEAELKSSFSKGTFRADGRRQVKR